MVAVALARAQAAAVAGLREARVSRACDEGIEGLPAEFFDKFDQWQAKYSRDSLSRSREMLFGLYERKLLPNLDAAMQRCPLAVLEIMMNSVLASYVDYSPTDGEALYSLTMRLASEAPSESLVSKMLEEWKADTAYIYPFIFGKRQWPHFTSNLKVYVYDVPEELVGKSLQCVTGQWGTEVLFHRFFQSTVDRTFDPEEADFFYVPIYSTCLFTQENLANDADATKIIWDPLVRFLSAQPWFARRKQMDHIFLFADGQGARAWDSHDLVRSEAVFMMVESKCPTWDEPMRRYTDLKSCSSSWKDIIIPGHTDHARANTMLSHNQPTESRDILMTFHGRHPGNSEVYVDCAVRGAIMELSDRDRVDVGGFVDDYLERKGRSHFCLIPGGTSPWTNQLYESFFCGCIPIILSDEYEVAFQDILDWPRFSIKWPEASIGDELYEFLSSFSLDELKAMKSMVDEHSCWFNYFSDKADCSPYAAVMQALRARTSRLPRWSRFWNVAPAVVREHPKRSTRFHSTANETYIL